ncbi:MAG TPA: SDR family NAD(P)-dependent oxidoreductase [Pyrinomonadaceae bacterium]|nr:SDR family NAD(P)-dependent oxidoreductase [Pyrinomonadaceae bacterium]
MTDEQDLADRIAIVGMTCRFPGARNVEEFWRNLRDGVEAISFFSDEELEREGVEESEFKSRHYVKARGILEGAETFDADFFGFTPREAEMTDPQHRLFLECCWEALEHAGYHAEKYPGTVGLFGGAGANTYLLYHLASAGYLRDPDVVSQAFIYNKNDHLTGRVAYKLNLKGTCVSVQTACSTSLVATSMACQSLLNYQVDMALAGGATIIAPQKMGYVYAEGGIHSPDGHCRAFDAEARGAVGGNGVGVVVLKRLRDALDDGDTIWAVIRGSAVNNDGTLKAGYTAPSVDGQAEVIALAQGLAGVSPDTLAYVEAHGTGTPLGDPIEIEALTKVFRARTDRKRFCAIGSVKTGVGHLDTAAGVAGLIKTTLMLHHGMLTPSLNFERPNPQLDLDNSPFFVNTQLRPWERGATPRRAGVSSFGLGGTNAHVVLEEAPDVAASGPSRPWQLLLVSAKTAPALDAACANLIDFLKQNPTVNLADVAHTLRVGRKAFEHRRMLVCADAQEAVAALEALTPDRLFSSVQEQANRPLIFMFPGQGSQFVGMGAELYKSERVFREQVDFCAEFLRPILQLDLRELLYPTEAAREEAARRLDETINTQPALFVIEYAMARLLSEWGVRPSAMMGHSIGEYVAACLSGVFSLEDALRLVAARARMIQDLPGGSMLAVQLAEERVRERLGDGLSLAAVNGVGQCVVSGASEAVARFEQELTAEGVICRRLNTSHAFHSAMMDAALDPFVGAFDGIKLGAPRIPYVSNVTGTWATAEDAADPAYWARHMRQTVRFVDGVEELLKDPEAVLLEVGPGLTLRSLARWHPHKKPRQLVLSTIPNPREQQPEVAYLLKTLGHLWLAGIEADWPAFNADERRTRIPLPTYPFERRRYWVDLRPQTSQAGPRRRASNKRAALEDWFYVPVWRQTPRLVENGNHQVAAEGAAMLVFSNDDSLTSRFLERARRSYPAVVSVRPGRAFRRHDDATLELNPERPEDYDELFKELQARGLRPEVLVNFWSVTPRDASSNGDATDGEASTQRGFFSLLFTAQSLGRLNVTHPLKIAVISSGVRQVTGRDELSPEKATVLGPVQVIPREYPKVKCQSIDLVVPAEGSWQERTLAEQIFEEVTARRPEPVVAYRDNRRWLQTYDPVTLPKAAGRPDVLKERGCYLITGGIGGLGLEVAAYLARACRARVVLVGRAALPAREEWARWLETHDEQDAVSEKMRRVMRIEDEGGEVLIASADVSDERAMRGVFVGALARFGEINGIIHAAGVPAGGLMQVKRPEAVREVLAAKVEGTRVLERLAADLSLDFFVLFSSLSSILGRLGQVDYTAANSFLDAFAHDYYARTGTLAVSVNWSAWEEVGMAANLFRPPTAARAPRNGDRAPRKEIEHLLLDRCIVRDDEREVYVTEFAPERQWTLDEHRIAGYPVIPGVGFFEMIRAALGERARGRVVEFQDVFFLSMLRVGVGESREVRLELKREGAHEYSFSVLSNPDGKSNGDDSNLSTYALGRVRLGEPESPVEYDLASFRERCNLSKLVLGEEDREEDLGPRWQSVRDVYIGDNEIFIPLEIPEAYLSDFEQMKFHPALLDRMTGLTKKYLANGPYLPFTYKRLRIKGDLPRKVYGYARYKEEESLSRETINFDLKLMDEQGRGLIEIEGFGQKQVKDPADEIRYLSDLKLAQRGDARSGAQSLLAPASAIETDAASEMDIYRGSIRPSEGTEALERLLGARLAPQVIVCAQDLQFTIEQSEKASGERLLDALSASQKPKRVAARPARNGGSYVPPQNEAERKIAEIWQDVLGVEHVGVNDNFFELGGSSLFAVQVLSRLRKEFDAEIPPAMIFEGATVSALAKLLTRDADEQPAFDERQSRGERRKARARERLSGRSLEEQQVAE